MSYTSQHLTHIKNLMQETVYQLTAFFFEIFLLADKYSQECVQGLTVYFSSSENIVNDKNQGRGKIEIIDGWSSPTKFENSPSLPSQNYNNLK